MKINFRENNGLIALDRETPDVTLAFTGDLCPVNGYEQPFYTGSLEHLMPEIMNELNQVDAHVINMEAALTQQGEAISKCGPNLRVSPQCVNGLKQLNVTHACLANNHIKDFGETGIHDTITHLESSGIGALGIVKGEKKVMDPFIFTKNGLNICLLNVAEAEFCYPTDDSFGASFLDEVEVFKTIQQIKDEVDIVIVLPHAGREYKFFPACWLRSMYRNFIDSGAHAVIAHHPHVVQGIESYNNGIIFYSLGNFIFDLAGMQSKLGPDFSFLVKCGFSKKGMSHFEVLPFRRKPDNTLSVLSGEKRDLFLAFLDEISAPLLNNDASKRIWDEYVRGDADLYLAWLKKCISAQPYNETEESQEHLAYLFSVLSMSQTHKKMIECIFRLLKDNRIESDDNAAEKIKSWEAILSKV
jgi:poly-gamma-glutamate synthesis protein (capsule biosynthesis protein)